MFIFSNLATSIDGKIATQSRVHFPLGTPEDRKQMHVLRAKADAIIMGASTVRAFKKPCGIRTSRGQSTAQPMNIVVSRRLSGISPLWPFFKDTTRRRIVFVTEPLSEARKKAFRKTSELIELKAGRGKPSIAVQIVAQLKARGVRRLLVEGGGGLMWDFCRDNLIDEYHLTLTPRVLGGSLAPTLVEGAGFSPQEVLNLRLKSCRQVGDELFLIYSRTARRG